MDVNHPQQQELLLQQQQQQQERHQPPIDNDHEIMPQLSILVRETQDADIMVQSNRDIYQEFVIQLQTRNRIMSAIHFTETTNQYPAQCDLEQLKRDLAQIDNALRQKASELTRIRRQLLGSQWNIFERLTRIQNKILFEFLPSWHHQQQHNNGVQFGTINLDTIQSWVEKIVDITWRIKNQIKGLQLTLTDKPNVPFDTEDLENFVIYINKALETLILNTFVVEKQPPQVMKTNTRFTSTVRFLCGNKLNVQMINPTVKALILSEQNARTVIRYHKQLIENSWSMLDGRPQVATDGPMNTTSGGVTDIGYNPDVPIHSKDFECSGEILNGSNVLEYQETNGQMISQFKNMQLKKIKRTEKKGTESVMDEKFILLFFTEFRIADDSFLPYSINTNSSSRVKRGDLRFHILAFSLPVVVIVHGNQEPHAWATVTWHNAFATPDEVLYIVPDRVPWRELGNVLSEKFRSHTGRGLSPQNLSYLASKVYRNQVDNDDVLITWNQFSKEPLAEKSFTFWEWFHSILKLTKEHLSLLWKAERIYGFIGKKGCVDLLLGSAYTEPAQVGTFLLRFSETELGGITIAWVSNSSSSMNPSLNDCVQISQRLSPTNTSTNVVMHLQPFIAKDLQTRSLADRIRDLKDLVFLYPNVPKNDAFEAYYTPINNLTPRSGEGYVRSLLVTTLAQNYPGSGNPSVQTESVTPNSASQCSPEGFYQETMSLNEVMDTNYLPYDPCGGDYNFTIQ